MTKPRIKPFLVDGQFKIIEGILCICFLPLLTLQIHDFTAFILRNVKQPFNVSCQKHYRIVTGSVKENL